VRQSKHTNQIHEPNSLGAVVENVENVERLFENSEIYVFLRFFAFIPAFSQALRWKRLGED
jgi:hypothetical protein